MVARRGKIRPSFNAGEFGGDFKARFDIPEYYSAAGMMRNAEPVVASGFKAMPGSMQRGKARRNLQTVTTERTVLAGPHMADAMVEELTFASTTISAVSIEGYKISESEEIELVVETKSGSDDWQTFGPSFTVDNQTRNRVAAVPPGEGVVADRVRIFIRTGVSVTWENTGTTVLREDSDLPEELKWFEYAYSRDEAYMLIVTPGFCDVWKNGEHKGAFLLNVTAAMVPSLKSYAEGDTVGFFHPDLKSRRALREGGHDHQWHVDDWPYGEIGQVDYGGTYTTVDDEWRVYLRYDDTPGDLVVRAIISGEETAAVSLATPPSTADTAEWDAFATNLQGAIHQLPSFGAGVTVTRPVTAQPTYAELLITFGGAYTGIANELAISVVNTSAASSTVSHTKTGHPGGEALISDERGWPGAVELVQDRIGYAGLKARSAGGVFSENGEYFNLNTAQTGEDAPFAWAIRADVRETINWLLWSKYLLILTDEGEYFANNRAIKADEPLNIVRASQYGSSATVEPLDAEGLTYFADPTGSVLYLATYDDVQTSFVSTPQSIFADHLFSGVIRSAIMKPDPTSNAHRLLFLRDDGWIVQVMLIRDQNVAAFSRWQTDGEVKGIGVDRNNLVYLAVKRTTATGPEIFIETWDRDQWLHSAKSYGSTDLDGRLTGLETFEGQTVWVVADGYSLGSFLVESGTISLPFYAADCHVGWWTAPYVETMPFYFQTAQDEIVRRPGRIHTLRGTLVDTTSIAVGANGETPINSPVLRGGAAVSGPVDPYSGPLHEPGLTGFTEGTTLVITQTHPGALQVRDIVVEAQL